jgi:hypothetical protein
MLMNGQTTMQQPSLDTHQIAEAVTAALANTRFIDVHTHLFTPSLGSLGLWGIDELITYHYLEAELFRSSPVKPAQYFALSKVEQADLIWKTLFVEHAPVSEASRGVIAVLKAFDLPTASIDLREARAWFAKQEIGPHIERVFQLAGISEAAMTNDPLDPAEGPLWKQGAHEHPLLRPVLRLDRILNKWADNWQAVAADGFDVEAKGTGKTITEVRRFLVAWCERMKPVYMAVSLPDTFRCPADDLRTSFLSGAVLPVCREFDIPLSLMIGVRLQVNPALRLAGDASGMADIRALEYLCRSCPNNRFLVSVLSRENQHELCVYARKFANLLPFGCWWFLNNPSIVEEITRERLEMLGTTFIPQHSDARILEQVVYKWRNTRRTLAPILTNTYRLLAEDGRPVSRQDIEQDVDRLFRRNFQQFIKPD